MLIYQQHNNLMSYLNRTVLQRRFTVPAGMHGLPEFFYDDSYMVYRNFVHYYLQQYILTRFCYRTKIIARAKKYISNKLFCNHALIINKIFSRPYIRP